MLIIIILVSIEKDIQVRNLLLATIHEANVIMKKTMDEIDNPALCGVICSPDYFCTLTEPSLNTLNTILTVDQSKTSELIPAVIQLTHNLAMYIIQGHATSNSSPDITFGERKYTSHLYFFLTIFQSICMCKPK